MTDAIPRRKHVRLTFWSLLVGLLIALNYAGRFSESSGHGHQATSQQVSVYSWSTFTGGMVFYAIWLGLVLLICIDRFDLLALRAPTRWGRALALAGGAILVIWVWEAIASLIPLPQSPGHEQGITGVSWQPSHAGVFVANLVLFAIVAPFVEELTFRGAGQSLLAFLGTVPSILLIGIAFGLAHGLLEALIVLIPFGIVLAVLRYRTDSVIPGMLVHGLFNGAALLAIVLAN